MPMARVMELSLILVMTASMLYHIQGGNWVAQPDTTYLITELSHYSQGLIDSKEKRTYNNPPIKIQTEAKNSNTVYSEHWS